VSENENRGEPRSERRLRAADRTVKALVLRRAGLGYREIAQNLGYAGPSGAHRAVTTGLRTAIREEAGLLLGLELERLDRLQVAAWDRAMEGSCEAIRTVLRVMEHRARLLSLGVTTQERNETVFRRMAEQVAAENGMDAEQVMAEARRILRDAKGG
jgi:hypothetical protein